MTDVKDVYHVKDVYRRLVLMDTQEDLDKNFWGSWDAGTHMFISERR